MVGVMAGLRLGLRPRVGSWARVQEQARRARLAAGPPLEAGVEREHNDEGEARARVSHDVELVLLFLCIPLQRQHDRLVLAPMV